MSEDPRKKSLTLEEIQTISQKLESAGVRASCPMCGKGVLTVVDGFTIVPLSVNLAHSQNLFGERRMIPAVAMVCNVCGFISYHAIGPLGLMETFEKKEKP